LIEAVGALGMSDNTVKIWNWSSNEVLLSFNWSPQTTPGSGVYSRTNIKFLANGLLAASSATSTTVNIWNVTSGQVVFSLNHQAFALEQLSNSNLVSSGFDGFTKVWSTLTGQLIFKLGTASHQYALKQINIPNGLASSGNDCNVYIWDLNARTLLYTLRGHTNQAYLLDSTPKGLLLSGSLDNTVKLWNVTNTNPLSSLNIAGSPICMKVVSSSQLVVGFQANYIQILNISLANVLTVASQVNLITNSQVNDMRLTMENILLLGQADGLVFFLNINTSTFQQALLPSTPGVAHWSLDLIG
jgi:WD40 repeat protein